MLWYEEAIADHAALYVVEQSFEFLTNLTGRIETRDYTGYDYPEVFWIALVKSFCYTDDGKFSKMRVNYALKNHQKFPKEFKCGDKTPMRNGECKAWISD